MTGVSFATVWVRVAATLLLLGSPLYVAVMGSLPRGRLDVFRVAVPDVTGKVPNDVVPFVKVTVPDSPVGRESVKVTDAPGTDGFAEDVKFVVGVLCATV